MVLHRPFDLTPVTGNLGTRTGRLHAKRVHSVRGSPVGVERCEILKIPSRSYAGSDCKLAATRLGAGHSILTKLGGRARLFATNSHCQASILLYAAALMAFWLLRNGSYTSPLTHSRCSSTASFRATATTARFLAFFPPRAESFCPQRRKSLSSPKGPKM